MHTLVIYAHPYEKSFNHAIFSSIVTNLKRYNKKVVCIDLYKDQFDPTYSPSELALFSSGKTEDPLVKQYQEFLIEAQEVIFIFPIWWNDVPAIVKGFIDKVMKKEFAYTSTATGIKGKITNVDKLTVYTTSTSPTWYIRLFCGDAIKKVFIGASLRQIGIKNAKWHNFGTIQRRTQHDRAHYLSKLIAQ